MTLIPVRRLSLLLLVSFASGCQKGPPRHLTRVQAFLCSKPNQAMCTDLPRGAPIPPESLPPVDQAFQLWAWHPGTGTVVYRADWKSPFFQDPGAPVAPRQSGTEFKGAGDSTMLSYNFKDAAKTRYVIHVMLMTPKGKIEDQDSLVWDYSAFKTDSTLAHPPEHHHEQM